MHGGSPKNDDGVSVRPRAPNDQEAEYQERSHMKDAKSQPKGRNSRSEPQDLKLVGIDYNVGLAAEDRLCTACPFQSRLRWVDTKRRWSDLFAEAVESDARMRDGLAYAKEPYLHVLRMPVDEAIALDEANLVAGARKDGFGNECEGHCGV